jgi:hypothetical protein
MKYEKISPSQYVQILSTLLGLAAVIIGLYVTTRLAPLSESIAVVEAKTNYLEDKYINIDNKLNQLITMHLKD